MDIEDLEAGEDAAGGSLTGDFGRFAIEAHCLRVAQRFEGIGHGEWNAGEGLAVNFGLRFRREKADVDAVDGVLTPGLREDGLQIGRRSTGTEVRLLKGAVERSAIGDEQAQVAGGNASGKLDGDANVALRLLPGTERGLDFHRVTGVDNVAGDDASLLEGDLYVARDGFDMEIDLANDALARAVGI